MSMDGQGTKCRRNIAENVNRLSRVHERYRETDNRHTDDRQTDGRQQLATLKMGRKLGGGLCPFLERGAGTTWPGPRPTSMLSKYHLAPYSRLATIDMGRKLRGSAPFWGGELGPHLTQCHLDQGLPPYQVAS